MIGSILALAAMIQEAPLASAPKPATRPPACEGYPYNRFDFWVGDWEVAPTAGGDVVAYSRIEKVSEGCAVRETWMPFKGGGGSSVTAYDPKTARWRQTWIGALPGPVLFDGGPVEKSMVLTGYWGMDQNGRPNLVRMTYTPGEDGSVRQYGQSSIDHGLTWTDAFDLTYRPRLKGAEE